MTSGLTFLVVGAQKAGTTALHHYLSQHPQVYLPSVKETHFFNDGHGELARGRDFYLEKYFGDAEPRQVLGEVDPEYLYFPDCPDRIVEAFPDARLVFVFRDPVARAYSHYWMNVRRGWETLSFEEALEAEAARIARVRAEWPRTKEWSRHSYAGRGRYHEQVSRYLERFARERMLFLFSDDLARDPAAVMREVYGFLGVAFQAPQPLEEGQRNQSAVPKSALVRDLVNRPSLLKRAARQLLPKGLRARIWGTVDRWNARPAKAQPLEPAVEAALRARFAPDVARLAELTGRDLSAWTASGAAAGREPAPPLPDGART